MNKIDFYKSVEDILHNNILSFWQSKMVDHINGGFYGQMTGDGKLIPQATKGAVLHARILWAFAAAYRMSKQESYLEMADIAKQYLLNHFVDKHYGGVYWSVNADGSPLDTKKQIYALGFAIYGLSEYSRATGDVESREHAINLYRVIEEHSFDKKNNGYLEALTRDWQEISDMRLSAKDANEKKTMNTHLHILEPYTNLYRIWPSEELKSRLQNLIGIFRNHIFNPATSHLGLFFNEQWQSRDAGFSYGHDIEASWLLLEAAHELKDEQLIKEVKQTCLKIANAALEGLQPDGSLIYEQHADGKIYTERHWWVQAEAVVGLIWLWKYHSDESAYNKAVACWQYITTNLVDYEKGEWWWGVYADETKNITDDKAGFWKCPYHNARMCLEVMATLELKKDK